MKTIIKTIPQFQPFERESMCQLSITLQFLAQKCRRLVPMYAALCLAWRERLILWAIAVATISEVGI